MAASPVSIAMEEPRLRDAVGMALEGSPEALSELYALHYRYVLWVCQRFFWRPEDAEDAAAEVFLKLHRVLGSHDPSLPFRPWLSQVASRHCIDKLRRCEREPRCCVKEDEITALPDVSTASPLTQVLRDEEQRQLREELKRLPERYRLPLVLRYYKRMSYNEIARTLGRQLPVVKTTLFRAKKELRRKLMRSEGAARVPGPPADALSPV